MNNTKSKEPSLCVVLFWCIPRRYKLINMVILDFYRLLPNGFSLIHPQQQNRVILDFQDSIKWF